MPTAGCIRAGTAVITLMKESQMEPAGTLYPRVGYILHTTALIQLLQQGLWFCLIKKPCNLVEIWELQALLS